MCVQWSEDILPLFPWKHDACTVSPTPDQFWTAMTRDGLRLCVLDATGATSRPRASYTHGSNDESLASFPRSIVPRACQFVYRRTATWRNSLISCFRALRSSCGAETVKRARLWVHSAIPSSLSIRVMNQPRKLCMNTHRLITRIWFIFFVLIESSTSSSRIPIETSTYTNTSMHDNITTRTVVQLKTYINATLSQQLVVSKPFQHVIVMPWFQTTRRSKQRCPVD